MAQLTNDNLEDALKSDELPTDDILPLIWLGIKSIKQDTQSTNTAIDDLQLRTKALEEVNAGQSDDLRELRNTVQLLQARLTRSEISQQQMANDLEDLKSRGMKDNVIIRFDPAVVDYKEVQGENCVALVGSFFTNVMGITSKVYVQSAHRLGKITPDRSRAIIARIPDSDQRSLVFRNANRLKDTRHFISQQIPPSKAERKQLVLPEFKTLKTDSRNKAVLYQDKLFVKNKLQTQFLSATLPDTPATDVPPTTIAESRKKTDSGSVFRGYSAKVSTVTEVAAVKQFLVTNKPDVTKATHVIYAYRFDSRGRVIENFDSDRDWGAGFALLKHMREHGMNNAICIATRSCSPGFSHIHERRFNHINDLCSQAYNNL